jgi:hypothetical protein
MRDNMAKSQKESVVEEVMLAIPTFVKYKDNAILILTNPLLENIKANVMNGIINGVIEYSKDINNHNEVRSYARSMVMNHLKKAKELNGGAALVKSPVNSVVVAGVKITTFKTVRSKIKIAPKGVNPDIFPDDELREYAKSLV